MENNSLTPTQAPAPTPATSMPEFAAAPAAPAPVIPPATAMPAFGAQPEAQPMQPVQQPVAEQPAEPVSTLGEITTETPAAPAPAAEAQPAVEEPVPATTEIPSPVESAAPVETPAAATALNPIDNKKKPNYKLFAIIGAGVLVLAGIIFAVVLITGQPKPVQNPTDVPVSTYEGPDNSVEFSKLDKDGALDFLTAVGKVDKYYPEDFLDETDAEMLPDESEAGSKLLISYETKDQAKQIAFDAESTDFRIKYTTENYKTAEKVDYTVVYFDQEKTECEGCSRYVSFSNKIVNRFTQPVLDLATGIANPVEFTFFVKNEKETVERYLPAIVYLTQDQILYSSEFKETDTDYQLIANVIYLGLDEEKMQTAEAGEVPRAINLVTLKYIVDKATGQLIFAPEYTAAGQLKADKSFSVTDDEVKDLI